MLAVRLFAGIFSLLFAWGAVAQEPAHVHFGSHKVPSASAAASFGSYARGCLAGGVELPETAPGWQAMRLSRNRNWGHPAMIEFLQRLAPQAQDVGWSRLYVGDIGQPRGGPMRSGHRSHQIGLDVDIWLRKPDEKLLSRQQRDQISSHVVVAADGIRLNNHWTPSHHEVLRAAAEDHAVARIFVNAAIKRWMCEKERGADGRVDAPWLRKIRPWKGHNAHFHVRLACPRGSAECRDQAPPPPGPGCGAELAKWFPKGERRPNEEITAPSEEEEERMAQGKKTRGATIGASTRGLTRGILTLDDMPAFCRAVLADNAAALSQIKAYEAVEIEPPKIPVFFDVTAEAHEGFVGTRYFWRPEVDLVAARERGVSLSVVGELPPGLEFRDRGSGNGLVAGMPEKGGTYAFTVVARKRGVEHGRQTVSLTIVDLQAGDAPPPPPPDSSTPDSKAASLGHQVKDFLTEFTGDECFLAVPYEVAEAAIKIEAFADDAAPVYDFDLAFKRAIGIEARIGGRLITRPQCPALAFARAYPYGNPAPIETDDPDRLIDPNQQITVSVDAAKVRSLALMLIGADGTVVDLTDYLRRTGENWSVSLLATGKGPQVLVAIDTAIPIPATSRIEAERTGDIFAAVQAGGWARDLDPRASVALIVIR